MSYKKYSHINEAEWASMSPEEQLLCDPDRVIESLAIDEQHMALAQAGVPSGQYEFELVRQIPHHSGGQRRHKKNQHS